jgi:hypothetical protein
MNAELYEWEKIKSAFSFPNPLRVLRCAPTAKIKTPANGKEIFLQISQLIKLLHLYKRLPVVGLMPLFLL